MRVGVPLHQLAHRRVGLQQPGAVADEPGQPRPQLRLRVGGRGEDGVLRVGPQRARPAADGGVLEQLLLQLLDPCRGAGIGAQRVHVGAEPGVVGAAQLVPRIGADLLQEPLEAGEDAVEHPVVDPVGHPGRGRRRPAGRGRPGGCPPGTGPARAARPTGPPGAGRPRRPAPAPGPRAARRGWRAACGRRGRRPRVRGPRRASSSERAVTSGAGVAGQPFGAARCGQEVAQPAGDVDRRQLVLDHAAGEEVLLHEGAQARADLVLLARDDRGVRDRQPAAGAGTAR